MMNLVRVATGDIGDRPSSFQLKPVGVVSCEEFNQARKNIVLDDEVNGRVAVNGEYLAEI